MLGFTIDSEKFAPVTRRGPFGIAQKAASRVRQLARLVLVASIGALLTGCSTPPVRPAGPYVVVLGIAQDAGVPQAGDRSHPAWRDPNLRRHASCVGLIDPRLEAGEGRTRRWMFEATPDFKWQLFRLDQGAPVDARPGLDGIFLTHAHIGHYAGLVMLGHESMGAHDVPVYAMPRMAKFLRENGPWEQLVRYENIELRPLTAGQPVRLADDIRVTPFLVPHRQEYSEVVGFRIDGPERSVLFLPDIDSWHEWDAEGTRLEEVLAGVDVAYLDATFFADGEIPGRDMSGFPHPFIRTTMYRLAPLPAAERAKVRFIHLNHTNPALLPGSAAAREIHSKGFRVARELEIVEI